MCIDKDKREMEKDSEPITKCDGRWNGYYISASPEAYDKLISEGYRQTEYSSKEKMLEGFAKNYFFIENNKISAFLDDEFRKNHKPFYLVNGELTDKPKGEEDGNTKIHDNDCNGTKCVSNDDSIISIADESGTIYEFYKPDFECELLRVKADYIVGYFETKQNHIFPILWDKHSGEAIQYRDIAVMGSKYNLTPIKQDI